MLGRDVKRSSANAAHPPTTTFIRPAQQRPTMASSKPLLPPQATSVGPPSYGATAARPSSPAPPPDDDEEAALLPAKADPPRVFATFSEIWPLLLGLYTRCATRALQPSSPSAVADRAGWLTKIAPQKRLLCSSRGIYRGQPSDRDRVLLRRCPSGILVGVFVISRLQVRARAHAGTLA